jgi:ferredoxin
MIIHQRLCLGCGRCQPLCPTAAIRYEGLKSAINQDVCSECGTTVDRW